MSRLTFVFEKLQLQVNNVFRELTVVTSSQIAMIVLALCSISGDAPALIIVSVHMGAVIKTGYVLGNFIDDSSMPSCAHFL